MACAIEGGRDCRGFDSIQRATPQTGQDDAAIRCARKVYKKYNKLSPKSPRNAPVDVSSSHRIAKRYCLCNAHMESLQLLVVGHRKGAIEG
jgi:hypothetical protein